MQTTANAMVFNFQQDSVESKFRVKRHSLQEQLNFDLKTKPKWDPI